MKFVENFTPSKYFIGCESGISMKLGCRHPRPGRGASGLVAVVALAIIARAGVPHIDLVEPFLTNQVLIHFDTEANRAYTLQRCTSFVQSSNGVVPVWSNIYYVPSVPYNDHWVAVDTNTTFSVRFYRLMVVP